MLIGLIAFDRRRQYVVYANTLDSTLYLDNPDALSNQRPQADAAFNYRAPG